MCSSRVDVLGTVLATQAAQLASCLCARAPSCARARVCGCVRACIRVPLPRIGCGWNVVVMAPYLNDPDEPLRDVSTFLRCSLCVPCRRRSPARVRACTAVWCAAGPCTDLARHAPVVHRLLPPGKVHALAVLRLPGAAARRCLPLLNWIGRAASRTGRFRRPTVLCMRVDRCLWIAAAARTQPVRADHTLLKPYGATALPIEPTHRCARRCWGRISAPSRFPRRSLLPSPCLSALSCASPLPSIEASRLRRSATQTHARTYTRTRARRVFCSHWHGRYAFIFASVNVRDQPNRTSVACRRIAIATLRLRLHCFTVWAGTFRRNLLR
jgi:hypothetical protein